MVLKNPFDRGGASSEMGQERASMMSRSVGWCSNSWFNADNALGWLLLIAIIVGLAKLSSGYGLVPGFDFPMPATDKWQAVFLSNNQVYFGHMKSYNKNYLLLKDVYYLQVSQLQPPTAQPQLNLIKLGQELHGPEDNMYIPKGQILFWENMKSDSQVVQAIESTRK